VKADAVRGEGEMIQEVSIASKEQHRSKRRNEGDRRRTKAERRGDEGKGEPSLRSSAFEAGS
jgi:hypothetical protein